MSVYLPSPSPHMLWDQEAGQFRLLVPFRVVWYPEDDEAGTGRVELCAPAGMLTDLASVPRPLRVWETGLDGTIPAAVIHDAIYRGFTGRELTRAQADEVFHEVMLMSGVRRSKSWAMWLGVRLGGWASWRKGVTS